MTRQAPWPCGSARPTTNPSKSIETRLALHPLLQTALCVFHAELWDLNAMAAGGGDQPRRLRVPRNAGETADKAKDELPFASATVIGARHAPQHQTTFIQDFAPVLSKAVQSSAAAAASPAATSTGAALSSQETTALDVLTSMATAATTTASLEDAVVSALADLRIGGSLETPAAPLAATSSTSCSPQHSIQLALLQDPAACSHLMAAVASASASTSPVGMVLLPRLVLGRVPATGIRHHAGLHRLLQGVQGGGDPAVCLGGSGLVGPLLDGSHFEAFPVAGARPEAAGASGEWRLSVLRRRGGGTVTLGGGTPALQVQGSRFCAVDEVLCPSSAGTVPLCFGVLVLEDCVAEEGAAFVGECAKAGAQVLFVLCHDTDVEQLRTRGAQALGPAVMAWSGPWVAVGGSALLVLQPGQPSAYQSISPGASFCALQLQLPAEVSPAPKATPGAAHQAAAP